MKLVTIALFLLASALPLRAETAETDVDEGFSLLQEGAKIIMRSMIDEMEPALKELQSGVGEAMREMQPALRQLAEMMGDIRNYHAPEMLPNGDIIIRRKSPAESLVPPPGAEIDI